MLGELCRNLKIAFRLAAFDSSLTGLLPNGERHFWLSFFAFPLVLACAYIQSSILSFAELGLNSSGATLSIKLLLVMAIVWLASLHVAASFAEQFGQEDAWLKYVIASNFCALAQALITTTAAGVAVLLGLSSKSYDTTTFVLFLWSIAYDWFVVRRVLGLSKFQTTALIMLEFVLLFMMLSIVGPR